MRPRYGLSASTYAPRTSVRPPRTALQVPVPPRPSLHASRLDSQAGQSICKYCWHFRRRYVGAVPLRCRVEEPRAHRLCRAALALGYEDVFPVRDRLPGERPQLLRDRAELVVVDRDIQPALRESHRRSPKLGLVVDGVDPKVGQVDVRVPEHLKTHEGDVGDEWEVPIDV